MSASVDVDNPTRAQRAAAIEQLRDKLSDEVNSYCSDLDVWRFSVARQLDTEKAAVMINAWYEWRKQANVDELAVAQPDNENPVPCAVRGYGAVADANVTAGIGADDAQLRLTRTLGGGCWHKRDRDGRPVYIERAGRHIIKDIPKTSSTSGLVEFHVLLQEFLTRTLLPECSQLAEQTVWQQVVVIDLAGVSLVALSHIPALNMLREMLARDQMLYPERMHRTYVVNAPPVFVTAWKMIRSWLDPRVISKIRILGKDHAELLDQIPAHNLPSFLGGSCKCSHMPGGCVPSVPLGNYPDLPRSAYAHLRHQVLISYTEPRHSFVCETMPVSNGPTPMSSPLMGYAGWLGIKRDSPRNSAPTSPVPMRTQHVFVRFSTDRGRGMVVEVLWQPLGSDSDDGILVYPEALFEPQRAPVLLELEAPNRAGQLVVNWRVANFDEGQAPFPRPEEAQIPIQLEYSVDTEDELLTAFSLPPIKRS
ncbi:hypothetical protein IWW56_002291 [Coemansia sp. RSA 2131]|nr:hypothetical protein IWW56_002291 [Coemansia sp. RSA 2131]